MNVGLLPGFIRLANAADDSVVRSIPGLRQWYAADKLPVMADGTGVALWQDSSGNGFDVSQAASAYQPLYKLNVFKGKPAVQFDGSDDRLENTAVNAFASGAARTVFYVGRQATTTSGYYIAFKRSVPLWSFFNYDSSGPLLFTDGVNAAGNARSNALYLMSSTSGPTIVTIRLQGVGYQPSLRINGAACPVTGGSTPAADTGATGGQGFSIGYRGDTNASHNGPICEIITASGVMSDTDCLPIERYLAAKYQDIAA